MPFTPSHVAAILPFVRSPLPPAALVIGSMAPDLFYYVPVPVPRDLSHSLPGLVTIDLALGVVVYLLWVYLLRDPLIDWSPRWLRSRLGGRPRWGERMSRTRRAALLAAALLLGGATHIVWDSFSHEGWVVAALPVLTVQVGPRMLFKWLQYASTIAGAVVVGVWTAVWVRRTSPADASGYGVTARLSPRLRMAGWMGVLAAGLAVGLGIWVPGLVAGLSAVDPSLVFRTVTIGLGAAGFVAFICALAWRKLPSQSERSI